MEGADEDGRVYTSRIGQFGDAALGTDYDFKPTTRDDQLSHQSTEPVETFQTEAGAGYHLRRQFERSGQRRQSTCRVTDGAHSRVSGSATKAHNNSCWIRTVGTSTMGSW